MESKVRKQTRLVGFGELLLRLDTPGHNRFSQAESFQAKFTGGEANVLVAARRFGVDQCCLVSRLPNNALGDACVEFLNRYGIQTDAVLRGGDRLGILFVETGASVRPTRVVYDRSHTSFRQLAVDEIEWQRLLQDADGLHITGTAPALGKNVNQAIDLAMSVAQEKGCLVSFDCSYRSALWGIEEAAKAYRRLARQSDLLFASPGDASLFFGIEEASEEARIRKLMEELEIGQIAYTSRVEKSASVNELQGTYCTSSGCFHSKKYTFEIVDRIGSGDAFAGAVLAGIMQNKPEHELIEFATAAAVLKHTVPGDFCLVGPDEVQDLVDEKSLRVRR